MSVVSNNDIWHAFEKLHLLTGAQAIKVILSYSSHVVFI